jgi:hypothetical protein
MKRAPQRPLALAACAMCLQFAAFSEINAAVSFNGTPYTQNFNSLPITPENASLEPTVPWADDTTSTATLTSIPGWFLYHPLNPGAENGTNDHQRLRVSAGTQNTGAFYSFGTSASSDRALGAINADTLTTPSNAAVPPLTVEETQMYIGLQIVNNTGRLLTSFTLNYTGEQWRQAGNNGGAQVTDDRLEFQYSLDPAATISSPNALFTHVIALDFNSPQTTGAGAGLDGNAAANSLLIGSTVDNLAWAPGTSLFLRWVDPNYPGPTPSASATRADNGLGIDDLTFTAVPEPGGTALTALGAALLATFRRRPRSH